jgi:hypothetical protein
MQKRSDAGRMEVSAFRFQVSGHMQAIICDTLRTRTRSRAREADVHDDDAPKTTEYEDEHDDEDDKLKHSKLVLLLVLEKRTFLTRMLR